MKKTLQAIFTGVGLSDLGRKGLAITGLVSTSMALSFPAYASSYELEAINTEITIPWGITQLPNRDLLVTDRLGDLYLQPTKGEAVKVKGLPDIVVKRQGGLLDVVLHPNYQDNGWIYISYSAGTEDKLNTALIRAKLQQTGSDSDSDYELINIEPVYTADKYESGAVHFGSRIAFDKQGYLYFSIGDRGMRDVNPQDISRDSGKIYRLHDDGRIPKDNPFVDDKNVKNAKTAIYSYGHRNPQGLALNPHTQAIWAHEHGPKGGDELNIIQKGKNYGWPVISYGVNYSGSSFTDLTEKEGMEQPITYWVPSIAPSGMVFVTSERYPELNGNLLIGSLKFAKLIVAHLDGNQVTKQEDVMDNLGRVRSIFQGHDGYIYIGIDGQGVFRLIPDGAAD